MATGRSGADADDRHRPSDGSHTLSSPAAHNDTSASERSKRQHAVQTTGAVCPSRITRGTRLSSSPAEPAESADEAAAAAPSLALAPVASIAHRHSWPDVLPVTIAARACGVAPMVDISCAGGAGHAAAGTVSDVAAVTTLLGGVPVCDMSREAAPKQAK